MKYVNNKKARNLVIYAILLIFALVLPLLIKLIFPPSMQNYYTVVLLTCFVFAALGVAWNLIGGYGAQISWCHAAFLTVGAYTGMIMFKEFGITPWISVFIGMALSYLLATLIGYGTLKLRGAYFAIGTIAFAETLRVLILYFKDITGGSLGMYIHNTSEKSIFNLTFQNDTPFYYIMLALLCLTLFVSYRFTKSKSGYYLSAIKGDEDAAISLGIETFKIKLKAFQVSALISSAIGTFYGFFMTYIEPTSISGLDMSVKIATVAIIGGLGTLWGPVIGAFVLIPLIELAGALLGHIGGGHILYGLVLVIAVIFKPNGLITLFKRDIDTRLPGKPLIRIKAKEKEAEK